MRDSRNAPDYFAPVPSHECDFRVGQPVKLANPYPEDDPDQIYFVTGIDWEYRSVAARGWNITIATAYDIKAGNGATDGFTPADLVAIADHISPVGEPQDGLSGVGETQAAVGAWVDAVTTASENHKARLSQGEEPVLSGSLRESLKTIARGVEAARSKPARRDDWHYDSQGYCDNPGRGY